jgi:dTDP-4-dehydrorhamnose 3,5-epimerase
MNNYEPLTINGVYQFNFQSHHDNRGSFTEIFREIWFKQPIYCDWSNLQVNVSHSIAGVLRGLHYHKKQADYWYVVSGDVQIGLIDKRPNSSTFSKVEMIDIGGDPTGLFIPPGVAHGFLALTNTTILYLVNQYYDNTDEYEVAWDTLEWYSDNPILSERDKISND